VDLMHGGQLRGREAFKDMIKKMYQGWHPDQSDIDVGVSSDGSVAMVHWTTKGKVKKEGKEETVSCYGLNALAIGDDGKIRQSAGFRWVPVEEYGRDVRLLRSHNCLPSIKSIYWGSLLLFSAGSSSLRSGRR